MEILKGRFKKATLKFYDPVLRHDWEHCQMRLREELLKEKSINYQYYWRDYDKHIGYHFNMIIKSNNYKYLRMRYTDKSSEKIEGLYLWMEDIAHTDAFCQWICYCHMREETNFKRALPHAVSPLIIHNNSPQLTAVQFED